MPTSQISHVSLCHCTLKETRNKEDGTFSKDFNNLFPTGGIWIYKQNHVESSNVASRKLPSSALHKIGNLLVERAFLFDDDTLS